jgi:nicotinamide-nucleotide amidase
MAVGIESRLMMAAKQVADLLSKTSSRLVLAESCTSGLLAATLAGIPGVSHHFCGSFVTYRESMKTEALGVDPLTLKAHSAVSEQTTQEMAAGALAHCREATITLAITGHLGPGAPDTLDGVVFVVCQIRGGDKPRLARRVLQSNQRVDRQREACELALFELNSLLMSIVPE